MDIKLIIGFAIVIAMAIVHFGIQIYKTIKKEAQININCKTPVTNSKILIELTKVSGEVQHLGKTMTEYKTDNDKAHERIFNLINNILLKKGG